MGMDGVGGTQDVRCMIACPNSGPRPRLQAAEPLLAKPPSSSPPPILLLSPFTVRTLGPSRPLRGSFLEHAMIIQSSPITAAAAQSWNASLGPPGNAGGQTARARAVACTTYESHQPSKRQTYAGGF
eukprot:3671018-Pyramimonas_sp.AAC.1